MKQALIALVIAGAIGGTGQAASASTVNEREHAQRHRIARGVRDGELTATEAARLAAQQQAIRAQEARMRADGGGLGPRERARLQRELSRTNRNIYRQTHDRQDRD
jgi:hypothetical protein